MSDQSHEESTWLVNGFCHEASKGNLIMSRSTCVNCLHGREGRGPHQPSTSRLRPGLHVRALFMTLSAETVNFCNPT